MSTLLFLIVPLLMVLLLFAIRPNCQRQQEMCPFMRTIIAHRGLFDNTGDAPENSLPAFTKAIKGGYGIELDVQLTADQVPVVHHDFSLKRLCHQTTRIRSATAATLQQIPLAQSSATIPTLQEVLTLVDGQVPLVIEIKNNDDNWKESAKITAEILDDYDGSYCVEAFDPRVIWWFKKNRPAVLRGILSTNFFKSKKEMPYWKRLVATHLLTNFIIQPDFIAYHYADKNQLFYWLCRRLYRPINAAWTVRNEETLALVQKDFQIAICDSFLPDHLSLLKIPTKK